MTRFSTPLRNTLISLTFVGATFAASLTAQAGEMTAERNWSQEAASVVQENMQFPRMAEIKGQSGSALVRVTINHSGEITNYSLVQSSGYHIIDREAVRTVERIGSFPATNFTDNQKTNVNLSLNYHLPKSFSEKTALNRALKNKGYVSTKDVASLSGSPVFASLQIVPSEEG